MAAYKDEARGTWYVSFHYNDWTGKNKRKLKRGFRTRTVDLPEVAGFEMLDGHMKLQKLNKEIVDAFVEEIIVFARDRVEIKWKFRDEFKME